MSASVNRTTLILGGTRSGKSARAEQLLADCPSPIYLATAQPSDDEMRRRIDEHRARRRAHWRLVEAPVELAAALDAADAPALVDDVAIWLTNLLLAGADVATRTAELLRALGARSHPTVIVSAETGLGIVPADPLSRRFRDEAGHLNQRLAAHADTVELVVAGLSLRLK